MFKVTKQNAAPLENAIIRELKTFFSRLFSFGRETRSATPMTIVINDIDNNNKHPK